MTDGKKMHQAAPRDASRTPRHGFTLVELLVVVAIIGILVSLLLPAVQSAREAVRCASCSNNIVQLIMAVHHYESTHRVYPPGTVNPTGPIVNQLKGYHHGWIEQILPQLEKEAVYHHIDGDASVYHKINVPVRKLAFPWLQCPSSWQWGDAYSHYAALHHDVEASIDVDQNGVFFLNSAVSQDDVSDGLGYTIFLGEKIIERGDLGWMSGTRAILRNTGEPINTASVYLRQPGMRAAISRMPPGVAEALAEDVGEGAGGMGAGNDYGFDEGPAFEPPDEVGDMEELDELKELDDLEELNAWVGANGGTTSRTTATSVGGFASFHPGGGNFAMGDGSVRFLASTMTMSIYRQLGHRADGELVELE